METFRCLMNRQLRDVIADMDVISTAECLALSLPSAPERTPTHAGAASFFFVIDCHGVWKRGWPFVVYRTFVECCK